MSNARGLTHRARRAHTGPIMNCTGFRSLHACMPAMQVVFFLPERCR